MTALIDLFSGGDHAQLLRWVCTTYGIVSTESGFQNPHRMRRETIARRLRLYRGQSYVDVCAAIDAIYNNPDYRAQLKRYVPYALEQNVTKRIVDEIASLYDRPVLRTLKNEAQMPAFRAEEKRLRLHELAQEGHRLMTLCNEVLQWQFQGGDAKSRIRLVTPDMFDVIPHPSDALLPVAYLIDYPPAMTFGTALDSDRLPHFELWDDTHRYLINKQGALVNERGQPATSPIEHKLGRIPGVLLHRREPTTCLLDSTTGSDIESCHLGVALLNVMIMRLSKSQGERQPVLQGNLAAMAAGQSMDGERPLLLPPEVVASMLDTKTDPDHYLAVKREKLTSTGLTYGISYEQFMNSEAGDSGKLYELRREKLKEIRGESRRRAVINESETVELMGFDSNGMRLDYQEQAMPQDAKEKLELLREKMKIGLDSPIAYMMREDQDLTPEDARGRMRSNLRDYAELIVLVRALNMPGDADAENPGQSPQENGADNQPKGDGEPQDSTMPMKVVAS